MTIRKKILDAMAAALNGVEALEDRVYRSRVAAFSHEDSPAVALRRLNEDVSVQGEMAERDFMVGISILTRGATADDDADDLAAKVHEALASDPSFGGLAAGLFEVGSGWNLVDADDTACELVIRYRVRYYTPEGSLTQQLS